MRTYLTRRVLQLVPLFFIMTIMTYGLMHLAPGGPEAVFLAGEDPNIRPEDIQALRKQWGLDAPFHVQYGKWLYRVVVKQDLGRSYATQRPVVEAMAARMPATIQLNAVTLLLIYGLSIPLGVIVAVRQYSFFDYVMSTFSFVGYAMPSFWIGLMLIFLFALNSGGVIPTSGYASPGVTAETHGLIPVLVDRARYMILSVIAVVTGGVAALTRYMRNSMLEVMKEDYIRTARAKGLAEKIVIYKHALRNALVPIVTLSGGLIGGLFAGSAIIERVFAWPGIGQLWLNAVDKKDYPVVMAFLLLGFLVNTASSFLTDILYVIVDPRIKYS